MPDALRLSIWPNDMKLFIFNCFLTYKAANSKVTGALNGRSEAPQALGTGQEEDAQMVGVSRSHAKIDVP